MSAASETFGEHIDTGLTKCGLDVLASVLGSPMRLQMAEGLVALSRHDDAESPANVTRAAGARRLSDPPSRKRPTTRSEPAPEEDVHEKEPISSPDGEKPLSAYERRKKLNREAAARARYRIRAKIQENYSEGAFLCRENGNVIDDIAAWRSMKAKQAPSARFAAMKAYLLHCNSTLAAALSDKQSTQATTDRNAAWTKLLHVPDAYGLDPKTVEVPANIDVSQRVHVSSVVPCPTGIRLDGKDGLNGFMPQCWAVSMLTTRDASASYVSGLRAAAAPAAAAALPPLPPQKRMRIGSVLPQEPVESVIDAPLLNNTAAVPPRAETPPVPNDIAALLPQLAQASVNMSPRLASALLACYLTIQQNPSITPSPYSLSSVTPTEGTTASKPATPMNDDSRVDRHPRSPSRPPPAHADLVGISSAVATGIMMPSLLRRGSSSSPTNADMVEMQAHYQAHMEKFRQSGGTPTLTGQFRTVSPQNHVPTYRSTQYAMQNALGRPSHGYSSRIGDSSSQIVTVTTTPLVDSVASKPAGGMASPVIASPLASPLGTRNAAIPTPDAPQPYSGDQLVGAARQSVSL